jgi:hypothetical protein
MRKLILLFTILTIAAIAAKAQIMPDWTWAKAIGGTQGVQVQSVLMDDAGNMYVSATAFKGPLTMDGSIFSTDTDQNIFVAKFNSTGNLLWKVSVMRKDPQYPGQLMPELIKLDKWNNLYLTVGTNGCSGNDTLYAILNANVQKQFALIGLGCGQQPRKAIIKLDPDGNFKYIIGMEGYGMAGKGGGSLAINASIVDDQGNLYLAGSYMLDSLKLGKVLIPGYQWNENSFIAKVDTGGNYVWTAIDSSSVPSSMGSEAISIILNASGNLLVFGDFATSDRKFGSFIINNSGTNNLYFVLLDKKDGSPIALKSYGGTLADYAGSITSDAKGNYYVTGFTNSSSLFGYATSGTQNYATFLASIDSMANVNWAKIINTELPYYSSANTLKLVFGADNFPVLTGLFQAKTLSLGGFNVPNHDTAAVPTSNDYFTARFDPINKSVTYLNSLGTQTNDYEFNVYSDIHNMLTVIATITDTIFYIGKDTIKYVPPVSGFIIAHFDAAGALIGKSSFIPYTGQIFSVISDNVVQSYSGYIGVAGGFSGKTLYLGANTLAAQDTSYGNMFISKMAYSMSGNIYDKDSLKVTSGYVKLFMLAKSGPAILVDSININGEGSSYYFNDAPLTGSMIYAVADTNKYHNYVGTYAGNSMLWTGAAILDLVLTSPAAFNVTLKQILPTTGPGTISGIVTETLPDIATKKLKVAGRPMKGASVVLVGKSTKGSDTIIAVTHADDLGHYQFDKVPIGNYKVWIDVAGLGMMEYYAVSITSVSATFENLNYIVSETGIYKDVTQTVKIIKKSIDFLTVYPNPATDYVHILIPMNGESSAQLDIYNISGTHINSLIIESTMNGNAILNTTELPSGIYILKASVPGKPELYVRFLKQ